MNSAIRGLIVTPSAHVTEPLEQLLANWQWPALLNADLRSFAQQLELQRPACVLLWIEDPRDTVAARSLIAWLQQRGSRPYRFVLAYGLDPSIEPTFRAAGVHGYLPVFGDVLEAIGKGPTSLFLREHRQNAAPMRNAATPARRASHALDKFRQYDRPP
jgi:hypothetical protein